MVAVTEVDGHDLSGICLKARGQSLYISAWPNTKIAALEYQLRLKAFDEGIEDSKISVNVTNNKNWTPFHHHYPVKPSLVGEREILAVSFLSSGMAFGAHKGKYRNPDEKPIAPISKPTGPYSHSKRSRCDLPP